MAYNELRDAVVEVATESTFGTAETTGFSTIEINGSDSAGVISPDIAMVDATVLRPDFDVIPGTVGRAKSMVSIPSYLTVAAANATPVPTPRNDILLQACGLTATAAGTEGMSYAPSTTGDPQGMTVRSYNDGILTESAGVTGGFSIDMSAGQYPTMTFTGEGDYTDPTTVAVVTPSYPDEVLHQVASASMTISGIGSLVIRSLSFNWDVTQTERLDLNSANGYAGTGVTGKVATISTIVEYQDGIGTWNPEALMAAGATHAITLTIGDFVAVTSGSAISLTASAAQMTSCSRSADSGALVASLDFKCTGASPFALLFQTADLV